MRGEKAKGKKKNPKIGEDGGKKTDKVHYRMFKILPSYIACV